MTTTKFFMTAGIAGNSDFQYLIQSVVSGLATAGAVQTADTGQLNPLTVVYPATNSALAGYLMYRFNDALQSTRPVFIKLSFGRGASNNNFLFNYQIGTGTNGAGTLTGLVSNVGSMAITSTDVLARTPSFVAGSVGAAGTGYLTFGFNIASTTQSWVFGLSISRTRNSLGVANDNGLNYCGINVSLNKQRYMDFINSISLPTTGEHTGFIGTVPDTTLASYSFNGETPVFPVQPARPYLDFPDLGVVLYAPNDIGNGQIFLTQLSGEIHKYWALGTGWGNPHANNINLGIALRYE